MALNETNALVDDELERAVLGSCLAFPELLRALDLSDADFASRSHRLIWAALVWLGAEGEDVDTVRLRARLADIGQLDAAGGDGALLALTDTLPLRNPPTERLRRLTRLRGVHESSRRVSAACLNGDLDAAVSELGTAHTAALRGSARSQTVSLLELCEGLLHDLASPTARPLVHPGYALLEQSIGSLEPGTTIGVLADTNVGKSTFCLETLLRAAARGVVVGYLSVEDQQKRVRARIVAQLSGVSSRTILNRRVSREDMNRVANAFAEIQRLDANFHTACLQGGTEVDVCAAMSELASRGAKIIAVDYIQKVSSSRAYSSRAHECANVAARITSQAQRLETVLFMASQCSRDKNKQNQCPSKHDMKESGDLENMLDYVLGLWREYEDSFAPTWCRVLKGKDGGVGDSWCMQRNTETARLEEVEGSDRMEPPDAKGDWSHRRGRA